MPPVTNTVAICPGYLGATFAQMKDLRGQKTRALLLLPVGVLGGIAGGILLLNTGELTFRALVPYLILLASGLLAVHDSLRGWLIRRTGDQTGSSKIHEAWAILPVLPAAIYGGYFGTGLSVIVLAVLGLVLQMLVSHAVSAEIGVKFSSDGLFGA